MEIEPDVIETIMHKMFGVYFVQGITIIGILYLIFSGSIKKIINKLLSFRKVKYGTFEAESEERSYSDRRINTRRLADKVCVRGDCSQYKQLSLAVDEIRGDFGEVKTAINKLAEHSDEVWRDQLKLIFYSKDMRLSDRIDAGLKYVWWGGNGDTKADVIQLCKENIELYYMAVKKDKRLRIKEVEEK